jgi:hypothetical protein
MNNSVQGDSSRRSADNRNGPPGGSGARQSNIIGTGHFVADSLPNRKRKFDRMTQGQMGGRVLTPWCADIEWFSASNMTQL